VSATYPARTRLIRSLIREDKTLELFVEEQPTRAPGADEVLIRVEAAPINPSDLSLLLATADLGRAEQSSDEHGPKITAPVPERGFAAMQARVGIPMAVGNEGAGTVVAAGDSPEAQALLGRTVAVMGGGMYAEYRTVPASACMVLPEGTPAAAGAAAFVNPLTALSFLEVARSGGHPAIVHTAAASNLGRMLNRICLADEMPLINVVRSPEQVRLLRAEGAQYVVDTSADGWFEQLVEAISETDATLGFDAVGGGRLAGDILAAMETAASRKLTKYSRYGSGKKTHVYIYGRLDTSPTTISSGIGFAWNLSGFLMPTYLATLDEATRNRMKERVANELTTTFASHFAETVSLVGALELDALRMYSARATGAKYLIDPSLG